MMMGTMEPWKVLKKKNNMIRPVFTRDYSCNTVKDGLGEIKIRVEKTVRRIMQLLRIGTGRVVGVLNPMLIIQ